jgi:hypothetical protein
MDLNGLVSWIPVVVFFGIILWVQRRALRVQLDRQKEALAVLREGMELQRESIRLLGLIASKLDRN